MQRLQETVRWQVREVPQERLAASAGRQQAVEQHRQRHQEQQERQRQHRVKKRKDFHRRPLPTTFSQLRVRLHRFQKHFQSKEVKLDVNLGSV